MVTVVVRVNKVGVRSGGRRGPGWQMRYVLVALRASCGVRHDLVQCTYT